MKMLIERGIIAVTVEAIFARNSLLETVAFVVFSPMMAFTALVMSD